jgi:hypothetical protein
MAKDPNNNRYAGIVSLPGADGKMPRPFRVDEDANVVYLDKGRDAAQRMGREMNFIKVIAGQENRRGPVALQLLLLDFVS